MSFATPNYFGLSFIKGAAVGDFNGDGKLDVAMSITSGPGLSTVILFGNGDGTFRPNDNVHGTNLFNAIAAADFNGDGKLDLIGTASDNGLAIALGNGDGTFKSAVDIPGLSGAGVVSTVDLNGDGRPDLFVQIGSMMAVVIGNGDGTFQQPTLYGDGTNLGQPSLADVNGDGKPDLIYPDRSIWLNRGDGTFAKSGAQLPTLVTGLTSAIADADGDGIPDIIITSAVNGIASITIYYGQGNLNFSSPVQVASTAALPSFSFPYRIQVADWNADGKPDLIMSSSNSQFLQSSGWAVTVFKGSGRSYDAGTSIPAFGGEFVLAKFSADNLPDVLNWWSTRLGSSAEVIVNDPLRCATVATTSSNAAPSVNDTITYTTRVTAADGNGTPTGSVTFTINEAASTATTVPLSGGQATFTIHASQLVASPDNFIDVSYNGDGTFSAISDSALRQAGPQPPGADFGVAAVNGGTMSQTVTAGQTATYNLSVAASNGFSGTVTLACSGAPTAATCSVNPTSVSVGGSSGSPFTVSVTTTARTSGASFLPRPSGWMGWMMTLLFGAMVSAWFAKFGRDLKRIPTLAKRRRTWGTVGILVVLAAMLGCGGGGTTSKPPVVTGTPAGTYAIVVSAAWGSMTHTQNLTLNVN